MSQLKRLDNKTIVISGGTKGVGGRFARECVAQGGSVVIGGRDVFAGEKLLDELNVEEERCTFVPVDLHDITSCRELFDVAQNKHGVIDGFVNYAGITSFASLEDCDEKTYDDVFSVNLKAAFFCIQNAVRHMAATGGGSIVLVSTIHASSGDKDRAAYAVSKGALDTLCQHVCHHYSIENVRCNILTMGWTLTEGERILRGRQGMSDEELLAMAAEVIPMGRILVSEDYLSALVFLLSDESSMTTGSNLRITGGHFI